MTPRLLIVLDLEQRRPMLLPVVEHEGDELRLRDWIRSQPRLSRLVELAATLELLAILDAAPEPPEDLAA